MLAGMTTRGQIAGLRDIDGESFRIGVWGRWCDAIRDYPPERQICYALAVLFQNMSAHWSAQLRGNVYVAVDQYCPGV